MVELFNTTINQIVEVPDEAADAYLAQPVYRKVKPADKQATDTLTITRAEYEVALAQARAEALANVEAAAIRETEEAPPA